MTDDESLMWPGMRFVFVIVLGEGEKLSAAALAKVARDAWPTSERVLHRLGATGLARPTKVQSEPEKEHWHSGMPMPPTIHIDFGASGKARLTKHWCEVCRPEIEAKLFKKHGLVSSRPAETSKEDFETFVQLRGEHYFVWRRHDGVTLFSDGPELALKDLRPEDARVVEAAKRSGCACVVCSKR